MKKIIIRVQNLKLPAYLNESRGAKMIYNALPIEGKANRWGDEIYFSIPVKLGEAKSTIKVKMGDLAYWPPGNAFCIFFGLTPASKGNEIRAASEVNIIGKINVYDIFKKVKNGESIIIEKG